MPTWRIFSSYPAGAKLTVVGELSLDATWNGPVPFDPMDIGLSMVESIVIGPAIHFGTPHQDTAFVLAVGDTAFPLQTVKLKGGSPQARLRLYGSRNAVGPLQELAAGQDTSDTRALFIAIGT